jgi:DNA-binding response OmpR family regulator
MKKVLVIEDDKDIVSLLEIHLKDLQCEVSSVYSGEDGLLLMSSNRFDLLILDLLLPGMDGLDVCRQLRMDKISMPILMLTARAEEIDKVLGLETGADDYLTKPFSIREFIARVKVIFRRSQLPIDISQNNHTKILHFGDLEIDRDKRKVSLKGARVELSPKEYELLILLASNPGKSYNRERLLSMVWGYNFDGYEHTVNSHINRLRGKIEADISSPKYILTTWGVGYRFNEEL